MRYHCHNQSVLLSWAHTHNAAGYYGYAQSGSGSKLLCQSPTTSCTIQGLDCGTAYNFSVQASDGVCNSSLSQSVLDRTGKNVPSLSVYGRFASQQHKHLFAHQSPVLQTQSSCSFSPCRWRSR